MINVKGRLIKGPYIVRDGLVLYLDAGNTKSYPGSGTTWTDLSGRGNTGTLTNGPTYNSTNGGSIVFDGTNDYVFMTGFPTSNYMSLCCWFKTSSQQVNKYLVAFGKNLTGNNGFDLTFQDTQIGSYIAVTGANSGGNLYTINYYNNIWHYLVSTYDGTSATLYYDGISVNTRSGMSGNLDLEATKRLNIGSWVNNGLNAACNISQVSVYSRALTAAEVLQNYNAIRSRLGV
jgi:hypothetical protein